MDRTGPASFAFVLASVIVVDFVVDVTVSSQAGHRESAMDRGVVGFHQDGEGHWVAELECGHGQHVRHDPPWECRPWVITPEGRRSRLGLRLNCVKCDRGEPPDRPS